MPLPISKTTTDTIQNGFRLHSLEVLNWGTFDQQIWKINPDGQTALVTGDIGSGKSTLIDALTALIVPHQRITYNKAAGSDSKERNLKSYVLGAYAGKKVENTSKSKSVYLRENADHFSIILGRFYNERHQQHCTLVQIFWMNSEAETATTPEKLFIVVEQPLSLKEHFEGIAKIGDFKKRLKASHDAEFFNGFKDYADRFRQLFNINEEEALNLFYQTVSMKQVENLTQFVRTQMLTKSDIKTKIDDLITHFKDLNETYNSVKKAREQLEMLAPIDEKWIAYQQIQTKINHLDEVLAQIPIYFAYEKAKLLQEELESTFEAFETAAYYETEAKEQLLKLRKKHTALLLDRDSSTAGQRLQQIEVEKKAKENTLGKTIEQAAKYQKSCETLGLVPELSDVFFINTRQKIESITAQLETDKAQNQSERDGLIGQQSDLQRQVKPLEEEIESLSQRKTQIPSDYLRIRQQIVEELNLDEEDIPFVGELVKIKESETAWEGAIENHLRKTGLSLLVENDFYGAVVRCVKHLKPERPLGYLRTLVHENRYTEKLSSKSVVYKVEIKSDTRFYDWIEKQLQRENMVCCDTEDEFMATDYAMMKDGQMKFGKVKHQKDTQRNFNRREFVLGWDNKAQLLLLKRDLEDIQQKAIKLGTDIGEIESEQKVIEKKQTAIVELRQFESFADIDFQKIAHEIEELKTEEIAIKSSSNELKQLNDAIDETDKRIEETEKKKEIRTKTLGGLETTIITYRAQLFKALDTLKAMDENEKLLESFIDDDFGQSVKVWIQNLSRLKIPDNLVSEDHQNYILNLIETDQIDAKNIDGIETKCKDKITKRGGLKDQAQQDGATVGRELDKKMQQFKDKYTVESKDFVASIEMNAVDEFITLYQQIKEDALPAFETKFKDNLRIGTIQHFTLFRNALDRQEREIKGRIDRTNSNLEEIPYNKAPNTHIKIVPEKVLNDDEIIVFQADLKQCTSNITGENQHNFENKYLELRKLLNRFMSGDESDRKWTEKVTDVRNWYSFGASERREDETEKEYYSDSSGKSGGQKEKLAYTMLAAAIVHQFGLPTNTKGFKLVVIDEAFGRGSEESARYGLELFKQMELQLLVVTPLQKINVIENYAHRFHLVINTTGQNSKINNLTKQEYLIRKNNHLKND